MHPENVSELQRHGAGEQNFSRCAEFNDSAFLRVASGLIGATATRELNRNANRRSFGKKAGQIGDLAGLRRTRLSCGLLRQAMPTLS